MNVVVIGGGVAGLATALHLGRAGHDVTVIERDDTPMPATADEVARMQRILARALDEGAVGLSTGLIYPPGMYAGKIAEKVMEMYGSKGKVSEEIVFDDLEFLARGHQAAEAAASYEAEAPEIEELLDAGLEEEKFEEGDEVKKLDSTLKIEDDEFADIDDET